MRGDVQAAAERQRHNIWQISAQSKYLILKLSF